MFFATSVRRKRPDTASRSDHTSVHFLREIFIVCCPFFAHCAFLDEFTVPSSIVRVAVPYNLRPRGALSSVPPLALLLRTITPFFRTRIPFLRLLLLRERE